MDTTRARALKPGRFVALGLIAVLVLGLAYLRFAPDPGQVSVPEGSKAGDLILEDCEYATENGSYAADCGTLVVPENRADSQSRLIALPVTRIKARSENQAEPIFRLEGGPRHRRKELARLAQRLLRSQPSVAGCAERSCPAELTGSAYTTEIESEVGNQFRYQVPRAVCAWAGRDSCVIQV
jgi:hypothetical protein